MIVGCINICQQTMTTVYFSSMTFHFIPIFLVRYQRFLMLHPCNIHNIKKWLSRSVLIGLSIHFHFIHQKMTDFPTQDASLGQKKLRLAARRRRSATFVAWRGVLSGAVTGGLFGWGMIQLFESYVLKGGTEERMNNINYDSHGHVKTSWNFGIS